MHCIMTADMSRHSCWNVPIQATNYALSAQGTVYGSSEFISRGRTENSHKAGAPKFVDDTDITQ